MKIPPVKRRGPTLWQRRSLAGSIELVLDRRAAARRGLFRLPRIPVANVAAVEAPLRCCMALLRDPAVRVADPLDELVALALHPTSPLYQPYPTRAGFVALGAYERLLAGSERTASAMVTEPRRRRHARAARVDSRA